MRLQTIEPADATGKVKAIYDALNARLGLIPNMTRGLANSPAALEGYVSFSTALAGGVLDAKLRELIAIAVAEANGCEYCLSAHTLLGSGAGLADAELRAARQGKSSNPRTSEVLRFAQHLVDSRGRVTGTELEPLRRAGCSDGEIAEIVAHVALNVFTNYFNNVAETTNDFPTVRPGKRVA